MFGIGQPASVRARGTGVGRYIQMHGRERPRHVHQHQGRDQGQKLHSGDARNFGGSGRSAARAATPASSPPGFPRVDAATQRTRDDARRKILDDELSGEEKALAKAKEELTEQESVRSGDERNYQKVLDRLQPYKDEVERHEKNVEALKKEINNGK